MFHAGDTAFGAVFGQTGADPGPSDPAIVPIAARAPRGRMGTIHAIPEDAPAIAAAVGVSRAPGVHGGTCGPGAGSPARDVARFPAAAGPGTPVPPVAGIGRTLPFVPERCT